MDTPKNIGEGSASAAPLKPARRRRPFLMRLLRGLVIVLPVVALLTWIFGAMVVSRIIDWQLKSQLASRVNARLETGSVRYLFPYGVRIEKAHLVVPDTAEGRGWGIDVGTLELKLAKLPLGTGPLVIDTLTIDKPVVRLSAADSTAQAPASTTSVPAPAAPTAAPATAPAKKLSDMFRLSSVAVNDARIEFDPGTREQHKKPVIWEHLNAKMLTTPLAGGDYQFHFQAKDEPLAVIDADGAFDIDSLLLDMQKLSVAVAVDPNTQAVQLPPAVQEALRKFKVGGQVKFEAAAKVPLDDPTHGFYTATMSLANGTGEVPGLDTLVAPAQFTMKCSNLPNVTEAAFGAPLPGDLPKAPQPLRLWVAGLKVCSDKKLLQIDDGEIQFDPLTGIWSVRDLKGQLDGGTGPKPIVDLNANGAIDMNTLVLDLRKLTLAVQCDFEPSAAMKSLTREAAPPVNVGGQLTVDAIAKVPLRTPVRSLFSTRVSLVNGIATVPGLDAPVSPAECMMVCSNLPGADEQSLPSTITGELPSALAPVRLWIHKLRVGESHQLVQIDNGELGFNAATGAWSVHELKGVYNDGRGNRPIASVDANGGIDLKTDVLDVQKLSIDVGAAPVLLASDKKEAATTTTNPVKPRQKLKLRGELKFEMIAKCPLKDPMRGLFGGRLSVVNGSAQVPGFEGQISPVQCLLVCTNLPGAKEKSVPSPITLDLPGTPIPLHMWIDKVRLVNQKQIVDLQGGQCTFDPVTLAWKVDRLLGIIDVGDSPGKIQDANVKADIPFMIGGSGKLLEDGTKISLDENSHVDVTLRGAAVRVTENHIPFDDIEGLIELHPQEMISRQITGNSMGGKFDASLETSWRKVGEARKLIPTYRGTLDIHNLDLHKVAIVFTPDESLRARTTGQMDFSLRYHGLIVPGSAKEGPDSIASLAAGSGDFEIRNGYFATIPVLKDVASSMQNFDVATIGQAAGTFTFANQVVTFQQAAASSPALGVQGNGTVGFDQIADMTFVATPLADWGADVNAIGNPALNGVANFFHKAEDKFTQIQAKALNQIRVTGPVTNPQVKDVPLPGVGEKVGDFFHKMSEGGSGLLDKIKSN